MKIFCDCMNKKTLDHIKSCLFIEVKYVVQNDVCFITLYGF